MSGAGGQRLATSGGELAPRVAHATPLLFSRVSAGAGEEDPFVRAGRRRLRWWAGGAVALALALASFAIVIDSSAFEARATVLIRPPSAEPGVPKAVGGALQSEREILRSFDVLRQALENMGIDVLYPDLEGESIGAVRAAAVTRMREALGVRTLPGSDVIEVSFRHPDARLAADLVNRLLERFRWARARLLAPAASQRFLDERIEAQHEALTAAETALTAFRSAHPELATPDPREALLERRSALEVALRERRALVEDVRGASSDGPSVVRARLRLDELELELQSTLNSHVEGSRAVERLRSEIGRVRAHLAAKERAAAKRRVRRLERLVSRQGELEAELAGLGRAERELAELERRGSELVRERDVAARRLDAYQREYEAAALAADVGEHEIAAALRVLESARAPTTWTIPDERAQLAWALAGVALVIVLGVFVVDAMEERRRESPPPLLWTAQLGTDPESGSLAVLAESVRRGAGAPPAAPMLPGPPEPGADGGAGS